MKVLFSVLIVLALVPFLCAQEPAANEPVEVTSASASAQSGEVRVEIHTTAPVNSPGAVAAFSDHLVLDLPGVTYTQSAHRFVINSLGVRDVRVWLQQENPPLTRISVELSNPTPYLLSADGGGLVLRIGPAVTGQAVSTETSKRPGAVSAGRPNAPARAAESVAGIFRRPEKAPEIVRPDAAPVSPPATQSQPPIALGVASATSEPPAPAVSAPPPAPVASASAGASDNGSMNINAAAPSPEAPSGTSPTSSTATSPLPTRADTGGPEESAASNATPSGPTSRLMPVAPAEPASGAAPAPAAEPAKPPFEAVATEPRVGGQPITSESVQIAQATVEVPNADLRTLFHVKFVQQDVAYIDGGRSAGLAEGMKLVVKDAPQPGAADTTVGSTEAIEAELLVVGVAETSAVTEIHQPKRDVVPGDMAYLSQDDTQALVQQHSLGATRKYPAVISFTEGGDALDEEAHAEVPRPPLPSVNHARGRIGFDYMGTKSLDSSQFAGKDVGLVLQADFTRIGGTYWNLNGFWRGQINSNSSAFEQQTLQNLLNRTYHLGLTYDNPNSHWVAGFGRLYLPWASSLNTIDGGYFGRRVRPGFIVGMFAGSAPDPTSWNYNPNLRLGGIFVNFEGGSFDAFHYSSTSGAGVSLLVWQVDRPFIFFENSISFKRTFSIYDALQADSPAGNAAVEAPGPGLGRNFLTVRWNPIPRLELDANHTYFRDVPTFDPTLVGTGLLDKYLFQGFSGGARVEVVKQISVYTELGRSSRTGDAQGSLNQMYGVTFGRVPLIDMRADVHYSRFNSSFGGGTYEALTLSRSLGERFRLDLLLGDQVFTSTLAGNQSARFLTSTVDSSLGALFFFEGGFTAYRGQLQSYNQWLFTLGYRFDSKSRRR